MHEKPKIEHVSKRPADYLVAGVSCGRELKVLRY